VKAGTSAVTAELQRARLKGVQKNTNNGIIFVITSRRQYRVYSEDPLPPAAGAMATSGQVAFDVNNADIAKYLPQHVEFVPAAAGAGGRVAGQVLRFNRLGQVCEPGGPVTTCRGLNGAVPGPQIPGTNPGQPDGGVVDAAYFMAAADNANWSVQVEDVRTRTGGPSGTPGTGNRRTIWITNGGRIWAQQ
jgi:hypothetical protein